MTLLLCTAAAIAATLVYLKQPRRAPLHLSTLCFAYWGASLMWLVDAVFAYLEEGAAFFAPSTEQLLNDTLLGLSVIVLGLLVWLGTLLLQILRRALTATA